ncbi:MAG: fatty acid desaturase [Pseudomonadota bacterium]
MGNSSTILRRVNIVRDFRARAPRPVNQPAPLPPARTCEEALHRAMVHMRAPVYYQFALFFGAAAVMGAMGWAYLAGMAPAWLTILINGIAQYFAFTVLHDSAHSVYCREHPWLRQINRLCAHIVGIAYLIPFSAFKFAHLGHHHHFNDPGRDPDHWVAGGRMVTVLARCATMHIPYYGVILRKAPPTIRIQLVISLVAIVGLVGVAVMGGFLKPLLVIWLIPAHIAIFLVAFVFDWLFHHPHARTMVGDAPAYILPAPIRAAGNFLVMNQTFHLIHHLYPRVPWTRVVRLYDEIEPWLRAEGITVIDLSNTKNRKSASSAKR